jgi:hypothetical protein
MRHRVRNEKIHLRPPLFQSLDVLEGSKIRRAHPFGTFRNYGNSHIATQMAGKAQKNTAPTAHPVGAKHLRLGRSSRSKRALLVHDASPASPSYVIGSGPSKECAGAPPSLQPIHITTQNAPY